LPVTEAIPKGSAPVAVRQQRQLLWQN